MNRSNIDKHSNTSKDEIIQTEDNRNGTIDYLPDLNQFTDFEYQNKQNLIPHLNSSNG